jgi:hypothetical protein
MRKLEAAHAGEPKGAAWVAKCKLCSRPAGGPAPAGTVAATSAATTAAAATDANHTTEAAAITAAAASYATVAALPEATTTAAAAPKAATAAQRTRAESKKIEAGAAGGGAEVVTSPFLPTLPAKRKHMYQPNDGLSNTSAISQLDGSGDISVAAQTWLHSRPCHRLLPFRHRSCPHHRHHLRRHRPLRHHRPVRLHLPFGRIGKTHGFPLFTS